MFHLLLLLFISDCVRSIPLENIDLGHCGKMSTTFDTFDKQADDYDTNDDVRIVGGFEAPEPVPWFVMLKINTQNGTYAGFQCGATLITTKFILTAAHCVCNKNVGYCTKADDKGRILKDEKSDQNIDMIALLGLITAHSLDELSDKNKDRHLRFIQKVLIHADYKPNLSSDERTIPQGPDIALLKMDRAVPNDMKSAPACLPASNLFPDQPSKDGVVPDFDEKRGVIIGMGGLWDRFQACVTSNGGPNPYQTCKFPFISDGSINSACVRSTTTPSGGVKVCNEFHQKIYKDSNTTLLGEKYKVELVMANGSKQICYDNDIHLFGWCGVCKRDAQEGQPGYCHEVTDDTWGVAITDDLLKEATQVTPTESWGWCDKQCWLRGYMQTPNAVSLQVANVDIFDKADCDRFGKKLRVNSSYELCAGKKVYNPGIRRFKVDESLTKFTEISSPNKSSNGQEWIIGGQDSCHVGNKIQFKQSYQLILK